MIEIRYSLDEAIDILGSCEELELLRQEILGLLKTDSEQIYVTGESDISAEPWNFVASGLEIIQNGKAVKVSISEDNSIHIKGSKDNLEKFASFLVFDENSVSGSHSHYEYYEGNEYIDSNSFPLIIGVK
jgi:hypothetical protein